MQQGFGVVLRLCGKCSANKMFSSVPWNLYGCFVVFINIMGIAVNLLKYSARGDSLVSWSLLNVKSWSFILSSLWKCISSCIECSGWHLELGGIGHSWPGHSRKIPGVLGRFLLPCSSSSEQPLEPGLGRRDRGHSQMGREVTSGISCLVRGISHSLFPTLSSSVASLSLLSNWKEGFPVLFCSFTQYLWYWCVLLSSESERRQKKPRYCVLFVEFRPSATVTALQVVHFSKETTELRQLWTVFLLPAGFWIPGM